jgi:hypothetical protein
MTTNIIAVNFNNQSLFATLIDNVPYVAIKPICESLGIDWEAQRQKINRHPILKEGACMIKAPSNGGIQEMLMLPIRMLNGWLFGIDSSRVKAEAKEAVLKYQRECFDVLANHFMPKRNALVDLPPAYLTPAMKKHINRRVAFLAKTQVGTDYPALSKSIQDEFNVNKREFILASKYREVCAFLGCEPDEKALQGELLEPLKVEYQPPKGMMLIAESELESLKNSALPAPVQNPTLPPEGYAFIPLNLLKKYEKLQEKLNSIWFIVGK